MLKATLKETDGGYVAIDEYGDEWDVIADDGNGNAMVERDAPDRWYAGQFTVDRPLPFGDGSAGEITGCDEDDTFGVSCQDEYIVRRIDGAGSLCWKENTGEDD